MLPGALRAELQARIEPRVVDELDTARLIVRATGGRDLAEPDLSALQADFEVLTTQRASQYRSVNGRVESWVEYQILLRPRRAGELVVPPIRIGTESTPPLSLEVRSMAPDLRDTLDRMVFFETELSANPVYVQAETVLIRRLYYASGAQIYSDLPGMPDIPDAVVLPLGETTSTATIRDGQRYGVIEQRFAIYPERSGTLTIPAIAVTSSVRLESGGRIRRSGVRIATEPMTVEVLPIPAEYPPEHPWLPARQVTLTDTWEPSRGRIDVGEPVTRTLRADVTGNVSSVIPPLAAELPAGHFRSYPEPPDLEDDSTGGSLRGTRTQSYAVMATAPGNVTLPSGELVWWDVTARQVRVARTPPRSLEITGTAAEPSTPAPQPAQRGPAVRGEDAVPDDSPAASAPETAPADESRPEGEAPGWAALLIAAALAAGLAAGAATVLRRRGWNPFHRPGAATLPRRRWQSLERACRSGDLNAMHRELIAYLQCRYATSAPEAIRRFREAGHGPLLDRLNAALYQPRARAAVSGDELLAALGDSGRHARGRGYELPALYDFD